MRSVIAPSQAPLCLCGSPTMPTPSFRTAGRLLACVPETPFYGALVRGHLALGLQAFQAWSLKWRMAP
eukprot:5269686-Lingulodinium_polyedra.AAC.1